MTERASQAEVLVVDDEPQVLTALEDLLEDKYVVHKAGSAAEGIEIIRHNEGLSVIISDQRMPEKDGAEFLSQAQSLTMATRVMLTGYADLEAVVRAVNEGKIFAYLSKPWENQQFRLVIDRAVDYYLVSKQLEEERRLLRNLMENLPDGIYFKDREHRLMQANDIAARILGFESAEEIIGKSTLELTGDEELSRYREDEEIFRTGRPVIDRILQKMSPAGTSRFYSTTKVLIPRSVGQPECLVGVVRDVTERTRREMETRLLLEVSQALSRARDTEEACSAVLSVVGERTEWEYGQAWLADESSNCLRPGPAWHEGTDTLRGFQQRMSELTFAAGQSFPGHVWASRESEWIDDASEVPESFVKRQAWLKEAGLASALAVPVLRDDSTTAGVLEFLGAEPRGWDKNQVELIASVAAQLAGFISRKSAEDAQAASQEKLSLLLESASEGVFGLDLNFNVTFCNKAALSLLGFGPATAFSEFVGHNIFRLIPQSKADGIPVSAEECRMTRTVQLGESVCEDDVLFFRQDGKSIHVEYRADPIRKDGAIIGAVVTFNDITRRKELENQLRQSQKIEAIGQLTGAVAHDFNNLLTVIMGNLQLLSRKLGNDENTSTHLERILASAKSGAHLTRSLLTFSRQQVLDPSDFDVREVLGSMTELLKRTMGENIEIVMKTSDEACICHSDRNQLENAILNLCINARDAMEKGGRLTLECHPARVSDGLIKAVEPITSGDYVEIAVSDTGTGMPPEVQKRMFDPFFTTKPEGKGTGLGLSTIIGFMKQARGGVSVETEPGSGTVFRLFVPSGDSREDSSSTVADGHEAPVMKLQGKALVVEDNENVRDLVVELLTSMGLDVIVEDNAAAGLEAFTREADICLVLSDVVMPGEMSGLDLAQKLRDLNHDLPIVLSSGYAAQMAVEDEDIPSGVKFIAKPYSFESFESVVTDLVAAYHNRQKRTDDDF